MSTFSRRPLTSHWPTGHLTSWNFDPLMLAGDDSDDDEIVCLGEKRNGVFQPTTHAPAHQRNSTAWHTAPGAKVDALQANRKRPIGSLADHDVCLETKKVKLESDDPDTNATKMPGCNVVKELFAGEMRNLFSRPKLESPRLLSSCAASAVVTDTTVRSGHPTNRADNLITFSTEPGSHEDSKHSGAAVDLSTVSKPSKPSLSSSNASKTRSFLVEDDSDSDTTTSVKAPPSSGPAPQYHSKQHESAHREAAKLESSRLRQQALGRNRIKTLGTGPGSDPTTSVTARATAEREIQRSQAVHGENLCEQDAEDIRVNASVEREKVFREPARDVQEVRMADEAREPAELRREQANKARKEADLKRKAERELQDRERKVAERKKLEEAEKARALKREALLKGQQDLARQKSVLAARASALEKLQNAKKEADARKKQEADRRQQQPKALQPLPGTVSTESTPTSSGPRSVSGKSTVIPDNGQLEAATNGPSKDPISLRRLAEQNHDIRSGPGQRLSSDNHTDQEIGEIRQEDVNLYRWRDTGMRFSEIATKMEQASNLKRPEQAWQQRYKTISAIFKRLQVPFELLNAAQDGNEEARVQLNAIVHGEQRTKPVFQTANPKQATNDKMSNANSRVALGEILPQDIMLLRWKDGKGYEWRDVEVLLQRQYDVRRTMKATKKRYRLLKEVLSEYELDDTLLDAVVDDDDVVARRILNQKIHGEWPVTVKQGVGNYRPRDALGHFVAGPSLSLKSLPKPTNPSALSEAASIGSRAISAGAPQVLAPTRPFATVEGHSQYGGKTITLDILQHYTESYDRMMKEEEAERQRKSAREPSPISDEDYCHLVYRVERRQISHEELEEGREIDDARWFECGEEHDELTKANRLAGKEALRVRRGVPDKLHKFWRLEHGEQEGDRQSFILQGEGTGTVEVRVVSRMRTFHESQPPESKERWMQRDCYQVWYEVRHKAGEDMIEEAAEKVTEAGLLDKKVYTVHEPANEIAVKLLVARFHSPSEDANTAAGQAEIQQMEKQLLEDLDNYKDELFDLEEADEETGMKVRVWVEESTIVGPRNLY